MMTYLMVGDNDRLRVVVWQLSSDYHLGWWQYSRHRIRPHRLRKVGVLRTTKQTKPQNAGQRPFHYY